MDRHGVRYYFEHRALPGWFFEDKEQFIGVFLNDKNLLYRIIDDFFKKSDIENPYTEDSYNTIFSKVTEDVMMLKIIFPEPEEAPLCYCSYIFFDKTFEKVSYFCIEKDDDEPSGLPFVCSWSENGDHCNHGTCSLEKHGDFLKCADIHMEKMYGLVRDPDRNDDV